MEGEGDGGGGGADADADGSFRSRDRFRPNLNQAVAYTLLRHTKDRKRERESVREKG